MVRITFLFCMLYDFFVIPLFRGMTKDLYVYCIGEGREEATLVKMFGVIYFYKILWYVKLFFYVFPFSIDDFSCHLFNLLINSGSVAKFEKT
ncbi:hypothetical protein CN624_29505 [Bacillus toyonensis]|nr:hypothetical protein CN688_32240 [Bacillus toyonensis]PEL17668.1 hypothetical protein CN624_29505 [Bacillus toyonensis]